MTDRSGVEIDYCPQCRGVWLDRGELDKIIERSDNRPAPAASAPPPPQVAYYRDRDDDDWHDGKKRKKKKGFLSEMFDFD